MMNLTTVASVINLSHLTYEERINFVLSNTDILCHPNNYRFDPKFSDQIGPILKVE